MSAFREQLRGRVARLEQEGREAARAADRQRDDQRQRLQEADATAAAILETVLRPLVEDFRAVMQSEGVLCDACLVSETADAKGKAASRRKNPTRKALRRPTVADYRRFLADRADRDSYSPDSSDDPSRETDDFERFLIEEHEREAAAAELAARPVPAWRRLACRGAAADDQGLLYEVRVAAAAEESGKIELSAACLRGGVCDFRRDSATPLLRLPAARVAGERADRDAARQWCARVLSMCVEALLEANFPRSTNMSTEATPAPASPAPVCAPLAAPPVFGEAMSFEL